MILFFTLSCGLPCECVVEHFGDEPLFGFGELGDGFELLFKFGDWTFACAARGCGGEVGCLIVGDERLDGKPERLGETGEHRDGDAALAAAGVAAGVMGAVNARDLSAPGGLSLGNIGANLAQGMAGNLTNAAVRSLVSGTDFGDNVIAALPDTIANTIGGALGAKLARRGGGGAGGLSTAQKRTTTGALDSALSDESLDLRTYRVLGKYAQAAGDPNFASDAVTVTGLTQPDGTFIKTGGTTPEASVLTNKPVSDVMQHMVAREREHVMAGWTDKFDTKYANWVKNDLGGDDERAYYLSRKMAVATPEVSNTIGILPEEMALPQRVSVLLDPGDRLSPIARLRIDLQVNIELSASNTDLMLKRLGERVTGSVNYVAQGGILSDALHMITDPPVEMWNSGGRLSRIIFGNASQQKAAEAETLASAKAQSDSQRALFNSITTTLKAVGKGDPRAVVDLGYEVGKVVVGAKVFARSAPIAGATDDIVVTAKVARKPIAAAERVGGRTIAEFGACFVAGTLVHTPGGLKPIEQLRSGDLVLSQPEMGGEQAVRSIVKTVSFDDKAIWQISYASVDGQTETIRATDNHPFWVEGIGWTAAELLEAGQSLQLADGNAATVVSAFDTGTVDQVFNFEVDGFHTYYVGQHGVWVHNTNCAAGELGRAGELVSSELTGLVKNTSRIPSASGQRMFRVPDHLEPIDLRYIAETKNVSRQSLTSQILDDAAFVTRGGRPGRVDVIIDSRTTITGPLLREHLNPGSPIKIIQTNLNRTGN